MKKKEELVQIRRELDRIGLLLCLPGFLLDMVPLFSFFFVFLLFCSFPSFLFR